MLTNWKRERFIEKVLKKLSQQRVISILQPGNVWVIEKCVSEEVEGNKEALRTCHLRGWVEILENSIPSSELNSDGSLPDRFEIQNYMPVYRLTEAGWNQVNRTHSWVTATCIIALLTLLISIFIFVQSL